MDLNLFIQGRADTAVTYLHLQHDQRDGTDPPAVGQWFTDQTGQFDVHVKTDDFIQSSFKHSRQSSNLQGFKQGWKLLCDSCRSDEVLESGSEGSGLGLGLGLGGQNHRE